MTRTHEEGTRGYAKHEAGHVERIDARSAARQGKHVTSVSLARCSQSLITPYSIQTFLHSSSDPHLAHASVHATTSTTTATTSFHLPSIVFPILALILGMDDLPRLTTQTTIGITVAVSGNVLISLALNLQKLAHKRLDEQKHAQANANAPTKPLRRDHSNEPSLNEQDEDLETITEQTTPQSQHTLTVETQPLLPVHNHSNNYAAFDSQEHTPVIEPQKFGFLMRIFRSKKNYGKKKRVALLPIDVMDEDAALHGLGSTRRRTDEEKDDQTNETAYLKSKLWYAATHPGINQPSSH